MSLVPHNEKLLKAMRVAGPCEVCGVWCDPRQVHHAFEKGVSSWKRIDLPWNLISLGPMGGSACRCHERYHAGQLKRGQILEVIARREKVTVRWIVEEHSRILLEGGKGGRHADPDV